MEVRKNMKALYIIATAGYADDIVDIARKAGVKGATIINGRGKTKVQESILGINTDAEIETIVCIVDEETADKAMEIVVKEAGPGTPANAITFVIAIDKLIGGRWFADKDAK